MKEHERGVFRRSRSRSKRGFKEKRERGGGALASLCVGSRDVRGGGSMEEEEEEEVMSLGSGYPYRRPHA